ncbi:MAG TPA: nitroreductase family protein [Firmicutes bacterium]|nr:nitroreductase family protein [Bacillota bacterium]
MELEDIERLYRNRQSCRAFDGREVPADLVKRICAAALLAPSACNAQPWKLVAVLGEKRKEVAGCLQGLGMNKFASDAGALVAVCEGKSNLTAKLGGRMKNTDFTANDLGILTAHLVIAAEAAGVSSCILGWRNEEKLREALGIRDPVRIPVVVALGYAKAGDPVRPKNRKPLEETFFLL